MTAWSTSELRGFEARSGTTLVKSLRAALKGGGWRCPASGTAHSEAESPKRVVVLVLAEDGLPVGKACAQLREGESLAGVVTVLGDDRGLSDDVLDTLEATAKQNGAEMVRVSLGGTTLLASHAIVILHHYLDEKLHRCEVKRPRDYNRDATSSAAQKRQKRE